MAILFLIYFCSKVDRRGEQSRNVLNKERGVGGAAKSSLGKVPYLPGVSLKSLASLYLSGVALPVV